MSAYLRIDENITPSTVQGPGALRMLVESLRRRHPIGADMLLIGEASRMGHGSGKTRDGSSVALVGLPRASIQAVQAPNSPDMRLLQGATRPGGPIGMLTADGSVRWTLHESFTLNYAEIRY